MDKSFEPKNIFKEHRFKTLNTNFQIEFFFVIKNKIGEHFELCDWEWKRA